MSFHTGSRWSQRRLRAPVHGKRQVFVAFPFGVAQLIRQLRATQNTIAMSGFNFRLLEIDGDWWSAMFFIFGLFMFFPVGILTEISEHTGWKIGWRHVFCLEVIFIALTVVAMVLLKRFYPELPWFAPWDGFCFAALVRGAMWFLGRFISPDDDL